VLAWLALWWKILGQDQIVTRCAMLLLAAFSLTGFFRLARSVSNSTVAAASTILTAIYPVFFAQSSLAHVDLPAAGLTFWGWEAYLRRRDANSAVWFSLAVLAKETAILVPVGLAVWELAGRSATERFAVRLMREENRAKATSSFGPAIRWYLILPTLVLASWYGFHYVRTGFVFGNPEFFQYNVQGNFHPLRILLALLLRVWQTFGYLGLYVLTLACILAMRFPALPEAGKNRTVNDAATRPEFDLNEGRPRISVSIQLAFLTVSAVYLLAMSVLGGAVLARYMLPIVPLFILVAVSTVWRRVRAWKTALAVVTLWFIFALFVNPPYGFSLEDNLAYRDYIQLHERAEEFVVSHYPHARVLTAWPASDELSRPTLGYVKSAMQVVRIEDFGMEQLLAASEERSRFDVALVFSTKYQPAPTPFDRWKRWQEWKSRYFGFHVDLSPQAAAKVLGGTLVYADLKKGQWVGVVEMEEIKDARLRQGTF
jgi:uncharacterized membrane protein YagU involved in acid resistance